MRRFLGIVALLLLASAGPLLAASDRDALLASDGTLFVAERVSGIQLPEDAAGSSAIRLVVQSNGQDVSDVWVPASLEMGGSHTSPKLAWDEESKTLFLFWVRSPYITVSDIVFCSYRDGVFSEPTSIDEQLFTYRSNLQVAVTRYAQGEDESALTPLLAVHVVWWNSAAESDSARYAQLSIVNGIPEIVTVTNLIDYLGEHRNPEPLFLDPDADVDILRHPSVATAPRRDRVNVTFTDALTNRINRIDLLPVMADAVVKPPIGIWRGEIGAPVLEALASSSTSVGTIASSDQGDLLIYKTTADAVEYFYFDGATWSTAKRISLDRVNEDQALQILRKMVNEQ